MEYEKALEIGRRRAEQAARLFESKIGMRGLAVCAVRQIDETGTEWMPVGEASFLEVAVFDRKPSAQNTLFVIVDEDGCPKACSWEYLALDRALCLVRHRPLPVSPRWDSRLRTLLEAEDLAEQVRNSTLRIDR
jgi:hypothetical protein